ncbi:hypothetical protein [Halorubrum sp. SD626R]|uniref:hypothetical protein n=1 Tax=Halorubrum sp. SD626R TaxID=1419722 RepID=UPI000AF224D1|nr:hypothetical protein [Halorubrum sp. SD626R]TKX80269.1 hypothetical protein EXE53_11875 [Halorubrum sp. SD626R]
MLSRFFIIALVVVASLSGAVAAQDPNTSAATNGTAQADTCDQYVTEYISLCSAEYDGSAAVLVLDADRRERITVTEAVSLTEPRELNRESFIVDGRTTIRFAVTPENGAAGVTIDDGTTLYGIPLESSSTIVPGPFTGSDVQAAGVGGSLGVALTTLYLVARRVYGKTEEPERIA